MAGTPLRAYIREIEKHIESGRNDEAIAHCRHILEAYPKYTDTYRLLGKAFLESQQYGDAADIFQRVLSSIPDDFVAHVGMSIIREDEGNLDEAIWHMERAFEIQPANSAIQDELRRLYGRRDGVEPPKIRLTRGALARMYYKGGLYQQAIAETRTALAENANRLDLQVLLAEIYSKTGQRVEAADTANFILKKIPYCLTANQIMAASLSGTDRDQEAQVFRERLNKLDPYSVYIGPNNPNAASVPDQAITLDKLEWKPGQMIGKSEGQPAWAASLGVELGELSPSNEEPLPEWLSGVSTEKTSDIEPEEVQPSSPAFFPDDLGEIPAPGKPATSHISPETKASEEDLPEWMKTIGEEITKSEVTEQKADLGITKGGEQTTVEAEEVELAAAEIPDWLRAMAPIPGLERTEEGETEITPWMDELSTSGKSEGPSDEQESYAESIPEQKGGELPDWLTSDMSAIKTGSGEEAPSKLPDWQVEESELAGSLPEEVEIQEEGVDEGKVTTPEGELPAWLFEVEGSPAETPSADISETSAPEELPVWSLEGEAVSADVEMEEAEASVPTDELPGWPREGESVPTISPSDEAEQVAPDRGIPEWLLESDTSPPEHISTEDEAVSIETTAPESEVPLPVPSEEEKPAWFIEEESPSSPTLEEEAKLEEIPDWLKEISAASAVDIPEWLLEEETPHPELPQAEAGVGEQVIPETKPQEELPESKEERIPISDTQPTPMASPEQFVAAPPETIESMPEEPSAEIYMQETTPQEDREGVFAWLEEMTVNKEVEDGTSISESGAPVAETEPSVTLNEEEEAFAWLEGLAVKQGAEEALLLKPEDRLDIPPEWIKRTMEEEPSPEPEVTELPSIEEGAAITDRMPPTIAEEEEETVLEKPGVEITEEAPGETILAQESAPSIEEVLQPEISTTTGLETVPEEELEITVPLEIVEMIPEPQETLPGEVEEITEIPAEEFPPPIPKIDLNQASLAELERIPGVGFIMAQRIIDFREANGPFTTLDDLLNIPDFNLVTLEEIKDHLYVEIVEATPASLVEEPVSVAEEGEIAFELEQAQESLSKGDLEKTLGEYEKLIQSGQVLSQIIQDLEEISHQYPEEIHVWQMLGDAYLRSDQVQQALNAYVEAERLL